MDVATPLSIEEHKELDRFLARCLGGMQPLKARGFLAAMVSGPSLIPPSMWLDMVMGHTGLQSKAQVERAVGLLFRLYNQMNDDIEHRQVPAADLSPDEVQQWCKGYMGGASLDDDWRADQVGTMMLFPLAVLAGKMDLHGETDSAGAVIEDDSQHRAQYREKLPQFVAEIHEYWLKHRRQETTRRKPRRSR